MAWVKLAMTVAMVVMPGGLVVVAGWVLARSFALRMRQARQQGRGFGGALLHAARSTRWRDIVGQARAVSGLAELGASR